ARLTGWAGVVVGVLVGATVGTVFADGRPRWGDALGLATGLLIVVPATVALVRRRDRSHSKRPGHRAAGRVVGVAISFGAMWVATVGAGSVRTDWHVAAVVPLATVLVVAAMTVALGTVRALATSVASCLRPLRAAVTLAGRHRTPVLVRVVLATAMVVAGSAATLGSSVADRSDRYGDALAELRTLPVVPPNIMALTAYTEAFSLDDVAEVTRRFDDSQVVPVTHVVPESPSQPAFVCLFSSDCALPLIVADPRLPDLFGEWPQPMRQPLLLQEPDGLSTLHAATTAPSLADAVRARAAGRPLPAATWSGLRYAQVDPAALDQVQGARELRTIFLTRPGAYSADERAALRALAMDPGVLGASVTATTGDERSSGFAGREVGEVPWAPTSPSTQWSISLVAALVGLLVVLSAGTVDVLDRRHENARLERLGASPAQVRAGAALHTGLELFLTALLAAASVVGLVAFGVVRFSDAVPEAEVPFVLPVAQLLVLVVVVPLAGAVMAAALARSPLPAVVR
ncbi:MAG: hypothetical protein M3R01_01740, partial [Actinomycetota bacterium]|nr:hypothetical protein [Actinomycetota bacterium]